MMESERRAEYIALKTLKLRCEYLQQRLETVEEENCKLKAELKESSIKSSKYSMESDGLEKQIFVLYRQKLQLLQQIQMMTKENQTLWLELSKLMPEGDSFIKNLSVCSTLVGNNDVQFESDSNLNISRNMSHELSKENFDEISFKLLNGVVTGKTELENQYSEIISLQKSSNILNPKSISILSVHHDQTAAVGCIKGYGKRLEDFKQILIQQKIELSNAISYLKNLKKVPNFNGEWSNLNYDNTTFVGDKIKKLNRENSPMSEMICPMCGNGFEGKFTDFYQHVTGHFEDNNEEYLDASTSFDIAS